MPTTTTTAPTTTTIDIGAVQRAVLKAIQVSYPGVSGLTITPTAPTMGLDFATGDGNVPDSLRAFAAAGVRGVRSVQSQLLDGIASVHVTANGEEETFSLDDLDDPDNVPGVN